MKPGYQIINDPAMPIEFKDKTIAVFNWHESNAVFNQTISGESVEHLDDKNLVAIFKIKYK